jgi:hypothetical protein
LITRILLEVPDNRYGVVWQELPKLEKLKQFLLLRLEEFKEDKHEWKHFKVSGPTGAGGWR